MAVSTAAATEQRAGGPRRPRLGSVIDHPVRTTAIVGLALAVVQAWWLATHRNPGGFGVDESNYLTMVFRFRQSLLDGGPVDLIDRVLSYPQHGPLVPLMSVPFTLIGGASTTAALLVQPLLYLLVAVAMAALVSRLSTPTAALVAGLVSLGIPVMILDARAYQFVLGSSLFLICSVLALVSSERGERRSQMMWFGLAVGCLLLSRTMVIAFLPGLAVAWWIVSTRSRRAITNLALAVAVAGAVALPWWIAQRDTVGRYLFSFGYGQGATQIESVPLPLRLPVRLGFAMTELRLPLAVPTVIVVVAAVVAAVRWKRSGRTLRTWPVASRSLAATAAVVGVGLLALLSSSNMGTGFQVPLELVGLAVVAAIGGRLGGSPVKVAAVIALAAATVNVVAISWFRPFADVGNGSATMSIAAFGGTEEQQHQDFSIDEPRFASDASWRDRAAAEADWLRANQSIVDAVRQVEPPDEPAVITMIGENRLVNSSTLDLVNQLDGDPDRVVESPATPEAQMNGRVNLDPRTYSGAPRVLVAVLPRASGTGERFTADEFLPEAARLGWVERRRIELPSGNAALVLTHPDSTPGGT